MTTATATATETTASPGVSPGPDSTPPDADRELFVSDDGYLCDADGEVFGLADPATVAAARDGYERPARFEVTDAAGVDWVLERMSEEESQILAIEAQKRAIVANLDLKAKRHRNALKGLDWVYRPAIEAQARRDVEGTGRKTAVYPHGQVAFRSSKGSTEIVDADRGCEFVKEWAPGSVKFKPTVKAIEDAIAAYTRANDGAPPEPAELSFVVFHGPSEKASIKTGVSLDPAAGKDSS